MRISNRLIITVSTLILFSLIVLPYGFVMEDGLQVDCRDSDSEVGVYKRDGLTVSIKTPKGWELIDNQFGGPVGTLTFSPVFKVDEEALRLQGLEILSGQKTMDEIESDPAEWAAAMAVLTNFSIMVQPMQKAQDTSYLSKLQALKEEAIDEGFREVEIVPFLDSEALSAEKLISPEAGTMRTNIFQFYKEDHEFTFLFTTFEEKYEGFPAPVQESIYSFKIINKNE